ncbi:SAM-dependent methyltransferase [Dactylosporangium sp. CA-092794]|uniref:SAM-dependent methyltransferase n=1 Tax=Dactylosporangium sp. CA-092794 TaxID=3239929 RepID=UPI003D8C5C2A
MSVDPNRPSAARIYDRYLGGRHNFAVDREVAQRAVDLVPSIPRIARANRGFLRRAVRYAVSRGVRQFLDIGSGIPTEGNVHEIAREADPQARVVYVDIDPTAVVHARQILTGDPRTAVVQADLHEADRILDDPQVRAQLDFDRPVCLLLIAMLHFVPDTPELRAALRRYHDTLAPGSLLAVSHATASARPAEMRRLADLYTRTGTSMVVRDGPELLGLLDGWELVEPGMVFSPQWRPDLADPPVEDPASYATLAAVWERRTSR